MLVPSREQTHALRVQAVVVWRDVLKVPGTIVHLDPVPMINHVSMGPWPKKRFSNQRMNIQAQSLSRDRKTYDTVPGVEFDFHDASGYTRAVPFGVTSNSSLIRDGVEALETDYWTPRLDGDRIRERSTTTAAETREVLARLVRRHLGGR